MENNNFTYSYSAVRNSEIESIRKRYLPKEESKLERLKRLDGKARTAGMTESLCIGIVGSLVFGVGMCIGLDAIPGGMPLAVALGLVGAVIMLPAYPIYRRISAKTKKQLAPEILALAEELTTN